MAHPDLPSWADFARGLGTRDSRDRLRRHLDSGCARCAGGLRAIERVMAAAAAERQVEAPAAAVRLAKALAALSLPERHGRLSAIVLGVMRDGAAATSAIGVRGSGSQLRHVLCQAGGFAVEVSLEPAEPAGLAVSGTGVGPAGAALARMPVAAVADGRVLASCTTGEGGEFRFDRLSSEPAELWLFPAAGRPLAVVLAPAG